MEDVKTFFRMIGQVNYILTKSQKKKFVGLFFWDLAVHCLKR